MAIYNLVCPKCGSRVRKISNKPEALDNLPCPKGCDGVLVRNGEGPTSRIVEIRDNGFMPKKVEQLANISELVRDRSTKG